MIKEFLIEHGFLWGPESYPYGVAGFMNYGPVGKKLKNNIEGQFKSTFSQKGFDEIETPVLYPRQAFEASGHIERLGDEMFHTKTSSGQLLVGRPEMATTIYPLFENLLRYYGGRMPFKVYQMGIALPNDRQTEWQTRTRQYTSHEGHIFFQADKIDLDANIGELQNLSFDLMRAAGIPDSVLSFREKELKIKPFYAFKAYGLYARQTDGQELELLGIQHRPVKATAEALEISFSSDRPFLVALSNALKQIGERTVLSLPEHLAPIPALIFPLKKTDLLIQQSVGLQQIFSQVGLPVEVVISGDIGRRYKKADALGVPFALTVDGLSSVNNSFTIRERDTQNQTRVTQSELITHLSNSPINTTLPQILRTLFESAKLA